MNICLEKVMQWLDTVNKGQELLMAVQFPLAYDRVTYMLELYPELNNWTHQSLAILCGLQRETVTRVLSKLRKI